MLNLLLSRTRGVGSLSGLLGSGSRWVLVPLLGLVVTGCATKGDLRDVRDEIHTLAEQQQQALDRLSGMSVAVQDTLRGQTDALFESRGEINRRLQALEQELLTIQQLLRMNQQSLTTIRDYLESGSTRTPAPRRTDTEPGQVMDQELRPTEPSGSRAEELYNSAVTQFNLGQNSTAQRAFQQFLRDYPNDPLAPKAQYHLADILVQEERPEEAIQAFLRIPQFYATSEEVPRAYYRLGVLYIQLDRLNDARAYLHKVVDSYPDSEEAKEARQRLVEIGG
jgi:tol-pal system protein YbgF